VKCRYQHIFLAILSSCNCKYYPCCLTSVQDSANDISLMLVIIMCLEKIQTVGPSSGYWTSACHRSVGSGSRRGNSALCGHTTQTAGWSLLVWKTSGPLVAHTVHFISGESSATLEITLCFYAYMNIFYLILTFVTFFQNAFELATFLWSLVRIFLIFTIGNKLFATNSQ
jgi:hypothetical protein